MDKVKRLRKEIGMKQKCLAEKLKIEQPVYCRLELGYKPKKLPEIEREAIEIMKPVLIQKLKDAQVEVERLKNLLLQY